MNILSYSFYIYIYDFLCSFFFFFNDTATTEIYTLSLHDALPIFGPGPFELRQHQYGAPPGPRSEEHTSELQSRENLVCRLLLEKKKKNKKKTIHQKKKKNEKKNNTALNKIK